MDPNLIDPSLLTHQRRPAPSPWPIPRIIPSIAESIGRLRRLPNQIGGVTIASLHSPFTVHDQLSFTSFPTGQGYCQSGGFQRLGFGDSHVNGFVTPGWFQVTNPSRPPSACYREILHHNDDAKDSSLLTQAQANQSLRRPQAGDILERETHANRQTRIQLPRFHCGEPGCTIFRTDGNSHTGKYAMSSHYKKTHPELNFDVTKLISSTTGQRSERMSLKVGNDQFKTNRGSGLKTKISDDVFHNEAVRPTILSVPAQHEKTRTQHEKPSTKANSSSSTNLHTVSQDMGPPQNHHVVIHANNPQLSPEPSMPKLPRVRPRFFTHVYDHHEPPEFFKTHIRDIRASCDTEFFTVRHLLLTYIHNTNQPDAAFPSLRKSESTRCLQSIHKFVTKAIGPSDLDARGVGLGLQGDTVYECALIITVALERVHLPRNGIWPDGTILPREESQRRYWCCELQAMKLCLFTFRQLVRFWRGKLEDIAAGRAATILLDVVESGDNDDCQMVDG